MKQNVQVHALPTTKASKLWKDNDGSFSYYMHKQRIGSPGTPYHIYVTNNEAPKHNDWAIHDGMLGKMVHGAFLTDDAHIHLKRASLANKVIATDDYDLFQTNMGMNKEGFGFHGDYVGFPQITPSFQVAFVNEINKGTPITEAQIELEVVFLPKNAFPSQQMHVAKPKTNRHGFVTILPAPEKLYTTAQVENFLHEYSIDVLFATMNKTLIPYYVDWLKAYINK